MVKSNQFGGSEVDVRDFECNDCGEYHTGANEGRCVDSNDTISGYAWICTCGQVNAGEGSICSCGVGENDEPRVAESAAQFHQRHADQRKEDWWQQTIRDEIVVWQPSWWTESGKNESITELEMFYRIQEAIVDAWSLEQACTTSDGVRIVPGLRVRDYDCELGVVTDDEPVDFAVPAEFRRPEQKRHDLWFNVKRDSDGRVRSFNGMRLQARGI